MNIREILQNSSYSEAEVDQILKLSDVLANAKLKREGNTAPSEAEVSNISGPIVMLALDLGIVRGTHNTEFAHILSILREKGKE